MVATLQDNQDLADVDIFDVSNPEAPVMLSEQGLESWPGAQGSYANGDTVFHHEMQHKRIGGHDFLLVSCWDAGQVLLNIDNPASPMFVRDSDYRFPDPLMPQFRSPRGNSHQAYWDADSEFNDTPEYTGPEGTDIPVGAAGESYTATTEFDGWGYVQLNDARDPNLEIIDSYAVPEALDEDFAEGSASMRSRPIRGARRTSATSRTQRRGQGREVRPGRHPGGGLLHR